MLRDLSCAVGVPILIFAAPRKYRATAPPRGRQGAIDTNRVPDRTPTKGSPMAPRPVISSTPSDTNPNVFILAYETCLPRFMAIPAEQVDQTNFDVTWATSGVLGLLPEIMKLRDEASRVPQIRISAFDDLEEVTLALSQANALYRSSCESPDELVSLGEEAYGWREKFRVVIHSFIVCGLLNPKVLDNYGGQKGYRNVAADLQVLTSILINAWREVGSMCPFKRGDLDTAANLAALILTRVGVREQAPASVAATADVRNRASTVFLSCWAEVQRAVTFLRWYQGDADDIVPALFSPPAKRKNAADQEPDRSVSPSAPATPAPAPADSANTNPGGSPFIA